LPCQRCSGNYDVDEMTDDGCSISFKNQIFLGKEA